MSGPALCRVCLASDVRMHRIESNKLLEIYEKLTSTKVCAEDRIPNTICYICYSQLLRCHQFSDTACRSDKLLKEQFICSINNTHTMRPCPPLNLGIVQNLSVTVAQSMFIDDYTNEVPTENRHKSNYICISEDAQIAIKIEVDVKEELIDEDMVKHEKDTPNGSQDIEHVMVKDNVINFKHLHPTDLLRNNKKANDTDMNLYCEVCSKKLHSKAQLESHMGIHTGAKSFTCAKCDKSFIMFQHLRKHIKTCDRQAVACTLCTETFTHMTLLKRHMRSHSEEKSYICDRCSSKFKTRTYLKSHMRIHSGEKPFACDFCGKAFTQMSNLKTHMKIHTGAKSFACDVCGKAFLMNSTLKAHMRCHSGEKPFKCTTCDMKFGFKCSLNQHIRRLHTEVKAYPCSKCSLSFNHEVGLTAHIKIHTADRPYSCDKCKKSFTSARNLKGHSKVHSEERPHACNKCGKAFKRPEHLRQHMKSFKCMAVTMRAQQ